MIRYGKTTQTAVAAMSRLAEVYDRRQALSSQEIAEDRKLAQPLVAKLLTMLAQAGLVTGVRGPGGGYRLARPPGSISMHDISVVFERQEGAIVCPFGPHWCGRRAPCPLHEDYLQFVAQFDEYLRRTRLDVFCGKKQVRASDQGRGMTTAERTAGSQKRNIASQRSRRG